MKPSTLGRALIALALLFSLNGEGRVLETPNRECIGGTLAENLRYTLWSNVPRIRPPANQVEGGGWARTPRFSLGSNYLEFHIDGSWGAGNVRELNSELSPGKWVGASYHSNIWNYWLEISASGFIKRFQMNFGDKPIKSDKDYCLDTQGRLYERPAPKER